MPVNGVILTEEELNSLADQMSDRILATLKEREVCELPVDPVSREELSRRSGFSVANIDRLVRRGVLPSIKIGKRRMFFLKDVYESLKKSNDDVNLDCD